MQQCPDCQYKTNVGKHLKKHLRKYGHGNLRKRKAWNGDKKSCKKKK